jgi:hypothetical protein
MDIPTAADIANMRAHPEDHPWVDSTNNLAMLFMPDADDGGEWAAGNFVVTAENEDSLGIEDGTVLGANPDPLVALTEARRNLTETR